MSHKHGTDLGGIRTLQDLKDRCIVDEVTECWHWTMSVFAGSPRIHMWTPDTGKRISARGRRAALYLQRGQDLPPKNVAFARTCCTNPLCVNPDHARSGTKVQWGAYLSKSGRIKGLPSKCAASRRGWDKRGRTLTPEMVAQIRGRGDESTRSVAERLGISQYAVWSVDNNLTHRPVMRGASVFHLATFG